MATRTSSQPRRTQAERRTRTQAALLDATIESLIAHGYFATTTRGVAELAGLSQGALQHHYPTKAALVDAALARLVTQLAATVADTVQDQPDRDPAEIVIDMLWEAHTLPVAKAVYELFGLAPNDPELAALAARWLTDSTELTQTTATALLPEHATHPSFNDTLLLNLATIRGTAIIAAIPGADTAHADWPTTRQHLIRNLNQLVDAPRKQKPQTRRRTETQRRT